MAKCLTVILLIAINIITRISSQTLSSITFTTDSVNSGDGSALEIEIYWNTNQYFCIINPTSSQTNTAFTCSSQEIEPWDESTITPNQYVPYYMQLEYNSDDAAIQISSIVIVDTSGNTYTFDDFCIR